MAFPDSENDELEIGLGINDDNLDSDINRIERTIRQAFSNIKQEFEDGSKVTKKFNDNILTLEKAVVSLTRQYANLGKAGASGFDQVTSGQTEALLRLTQIQEKLRAIDIEASTAGTKKSRVAELKKESTELRNELGLMVRDLLALQQLDIVLKAKILPEVKETPVKLTSIEDATKDFNTLDKRILSFQQKLLSLSKLEGKGLAQEVISDRAKEQLNVVGALRQELEVIRNLSKQSNEEGLTNLVTDSKNLSSVLDNVERELISINRLKAFSPEPEKVVRQKAAKDIDIEAQLRAQSKSAFALEKQLAQAGRQTYAGSEEFAKEAKEAEKHIRSLVEQILKLQRAAHGTTDKDIIEQLDAESKVLKRELGLVEDRLTRIRRLQLQSPSPLKQSGSATPGGVLSGLFDVFNVPGVGAGLGVAAGIAAVGYALNKFVDYGKLALDKTSELIGKNRLLASSAIEAGIEIDDLAKKNKQFATLVGLGDVQSASTVAKIAQLTTRSQRPEDIDKLLKGFANIAAARGLNPTELETIVQQIITGQDEGYKKLGLPNPGQLYQDYAKKNNRSAESLTSVERAQIFQNEFLKKAEIFNGSAEAKMNSLDGAIAKLYAGFDNLGFGLAKVVANSPDVAVLIDDITTAVKKLSGSLDELYEKQNRGTLTDAEITEAAKPGAIGGLRKILGAGALIVGKALQIITLGGYADYGDGSGTINETGRSITDYGAEELTQNNQQLNEDIIRRRLNAQRKTDADNRVIANERKIELAREIADQERRQRQEKEEKRITDLLKKRRDNPADIEQVLRDVETYQNPIPKKLDTNELERRVNEKYEKLQAQDFVKLGARGLSNPEAIKEDFRKQLKLEMEAALEVLNQPLFDEATKEKLIEKAQQDLSAAVQKAYKRVLDDPHIKIETVLKQIGSIKSDKRLFPEVQEALLREAKQIQERMAKISEDLTKDVQNLFVESATYRSGNPLVKSLIDVQEAFENTQKKFAPFGAEFAKMMADIAKEDAVGRLNKVIFDLTEAPLKLRQQARQLEQLPETQTDAFSRRIEQVQKTTEFLLSDSKLTRIADESKFFSERYNPYNPKSFLLDKYGYTGLDKLTRDFQSSEKKSGESEKDYASRISEERKKYLDTSVKIKDVLVDINKIESINTLGTGLYGKEAQAKAISERLPSRDELLSRLGSYGETKEEARILLQKQAEADLILKEANEKKYKDYLENQRFLELNRKDVDERLANIDKSGLNQREKLEQYIATSGELGNGELTPAQRQGRIQALNALASFKEEQRVKDEARAKDIADTMKKIKQQLDQKGLKVDLGDQAITNITVTASGVSVDARTRRAGQTDTTREY